MARVALPITVVDLAGNAVSGASITVKKRSDLTNATLYSAETGGVIVANPQTTNTQGRAPVWIDAGAYVATISGTGITTYNENLDLVSNSSRSFYTTFEWAPMGLAAVPSGQTNYLSPVPIRIASGELQYLDKIEYRTNNGAAGITVSFKFQRNGADAAGFGTTASPLVTPTSTAWTMTNPADIQLADGDTLAPVVTAIAGAPQNFAVAAHILHVAS